MAKEEQIKSQIILDGEKEYKSACKGINASLREIGSEMKLVTAEFSGNADSVEALAKKQEVLQKQLEEQAKKAGAAEEALKKMREGGVDPTSIAFKKMQTNLNNAKADMAKTQAEINGITDSLNQTTPATEEFATEAANVDKQLKLLASEMKVVSAEYEGNADSAEALKAKLSVLQKTYTEQEKKVQSLEKALNAAKNEYGENSNEAREYERQLNECKAELKSTKTQVEKTTDSLEKSSGSWDKIGSAVGKAGKAIGAGVVAMGATIGAAARAFLGLAESTREARVNMGKLETGFTTAGHSAEDAKKTYTELYGVLGDEGQATEAAAHLAKLTKNEKELATWTDIATGVYATFGDSLPIENLTEAANETAKTGAITGGLADALNWAGVSEDEFQAGLDKCSTEQERQALITKTLNGLYSDAAEKYREVNGDIIDAQKATASLNSAMAELGAIAEPIVTKLKQLAAELLQQITPFVELIGNGLVGALTGAEGAAQQFTDGLLGMVTFAIQKLTEMLPTFINFAFQMIANIATGIAQALPTLVPSLVQLVADIVQVLIDNSPLLIDAALQLVTGLAQGMITAIPVLVAALPTLITSLINGLLSAIPQIIQAGVQLFVALIQNLPTIIAEIVKAVPQIVSGIVSAFGSFVGEMVNAGANLLHGLWEGISGAAGWLWEKVSGWASSLVDGIKNFFGIHSPSTVFAGIGTNMGEGVGVGFGESMNGVSSDMTAAMGRAGQLTAAEAVRAVNDGIIANIEGLSGAITAIVERVISGLTAQAQKLNQAGQDFDRHISSGMITAIPQITAKIPQITQSIITAFNAQNQKFIEAGITIDKNIASGMVQGIPQITSKVAQIVQPILTELRSFVSEFTAAGEDMVRGIWQGFQNMSGWLESRVREMMREIVAAVEDEMQIASPSKVFAGIGAYMAQGLGEGFGREMRGVEKSIRKATDNAVPDNDDPRPRKGGRPETRFEVVQNIYANETSYAQQQREAARQFRMIAREVMT